MQIVLSRAIYKIGICQWEQMTLYLRISYSENVMVQMYLGKAGKLEGLCELFFIF